MSEHNETNTAQASARRGWHADLVAGFLVFLIALPLCLGIAMASGFPPIAGILTAVVGGVIATWMGSAPLTIKGPAAGLIVIALGAVQELGGGDPVAGYKRALAVGVVAGILQILLALMRTGALGEIFPSSVVHGMLAAIGVIIISKQAHTTMGVAPSATSPLDLLAEIPHSLTVLNPAIFFIGGLSLLILFGAPFLRWKWAKRIPSPVLVLLMAVPLGFLFDLGHEHAYRFAGTEHSVGPWYLVQLPGSLLSALAFPDFSVILSPTSLKYILMFALVGSIESLLSAKAVDHLDPKRRQSNLNRDLLATGVGNTISACIGGLPMISEIVRSSANISSGAKSRLANFFHGLFLFVAVAAIPHWIEHIPLAALGAMLIYTGFRLASPKELARTYRIGPEQLLIFAATLVTTLATDLLVGVGVGVLLKLVIHVKNGAPLRTLFTPEIETHQDGKVMVLCIRGAAVFTNYLGLRRQVERAQAALLVIDFSHARLVDHTVLEKLYHLVDDWTRTGRRLIIHGLSSLEPASAHALAARRGRRLAIAQEMHLPGDGR